MKILSCILLSLLLCSISGKLRCDTIPIVPKENLLSFRYLGQVPIQASEADQLSIFADSNTVWIYDVKETRLFHAPAAGLDKKDFRKWNSSTFQFTSIRFKGIRPSGILICGNDAYLSFEQKQIIRFSRNGTFYEENLTWKIKEGFTDFFLHGSKLFVYAYAEAFLGRNNHYIKSIDLITSEEKKVYLYSRYSPFAYLQTGKHYSYSGRHIYIGLQQTDTLYEYDFSLNLTNKFTLNQGSATWMPEVIVDSLLEFERKRNLNQISHMLLGRVDSITLYSHLMVVNDSVVVRFAFDKGIEHEYATLFIRQGATFVPVKKTLLDFRNAPAALIKTDAQLFFTDNSRIMPVRKNLFIASLIDCKHRKGITYKKYKEKCSYDEDHNKSFLSFYELQFSY